MGERYIAFGLLATRSLHLLHSVPVYHTKPIIELLKRHYYLNVVLSTAASGFHTCVFSAQDGNAQRAGMFKAVELLERNNHDRKTIDHEMISNYRRKSDDIPPAVVFTLARDGKRKSGGRSGGRR